MKKIIQAALLIFVGVTAFYAFAASSSRKDAPADAQVQSGSKCTEGGVQCSASNPPGTGEAAKQVGSSPPAARKVIAYYFHTTTRCLSCKRFEAWGGETLKQRFSEPLQSGALEWEVINVEEPENRHFIEDYQLHTKSIVLSSVENGKETQWKNLDKIWDLVGDQEAFSQYVASETENFLSNGREG